MIEYEIIPVPPLVANVIVPSQPGLHVACVVLIEFTIGPGGVETFTAEVKIQNSNLKLRQGMFSKIQLNLGKGNAVLVPNIALVKQTGTNDMYVFVNKDNVAVKTLVKTGRMFDDKIEIVDGIAEGNEIVVVGQNKLENKTPLQVKN